ncbi:hypothetical protein D9611_011468 [Ephemerocybe angulata]|uniref:Transport protein particle complex subunit n=1 Tax=Ephemerocybe angulata TaxID=980116 RepID=A0A8H5CE17_9AGAR|nr:hypothetical protein D9611_011468 [Tulosesus angulatus]
MSHHLFLLSPSDTPLYSLSHQSTKQGASASSPLGANLPTWTTSPFSGRMSALAGAPNTAMQSADLGGGAAGGQDRLNALRMVANASLDVLENVVFRDNGMYLKGVDKFNEWTVSAFVTAGNMKFILLHEGKNDDGIRGFFFEVWELYVKTMANPFHSAHTPIRSPVFDHRVRASAKRYL